MRLKERVSLITGGASGIGKQIVLTFADEGSKIAIFDIQQEEGEKIAKEISRLTECKFFYCDLSKINNIEKCVHEVYKHFGRIDILVNCAGLANRTSIENITEEEWDMVNSVNLKAVFFVSKEVCKIMKVQRKGKIINISSHRAYQSDGRHTIYDVTKAGIQALTRSFAVAFAKYNINVNTVSPGYVLTPMTEHNLNREGWLDELCHYVPMGRFMDMKEVANTVLFLASDNASGITGHDLIVDGGAVIHSMV